MRQSIRRSQPWPVRGNVGSDKREFALKQGDSLPQEEAPRIARQSLSIMATIRPDQPDGVIVSQGGSRVGFSLYLRDGKLTFAVRHTPGGAATIVATPERLPGAK